MQTDDMNLELRNLSQSAEHMQEFADFTSPEGNWKCMDKNITLSRHIGFAVSECPACFEDIRLMSDKPDEANHE